MSFALVHMPSRQTCTDAYLLGSGVVVLGELIVLVLLAYSSVYAPTQAGRLGALAMFGFVPAVTCIFGVLACRMHAAEDARRDRATPPTPSAPPGPFIT